jgi:hypothetical protein
VSEIASNKALSATSSAPDTVTEEQVAAAASTVKAGGQSDLPPPTEAPSSPSQGENQSQLRIALFYLDTKIRNCFCVYFWWRSSDFIQQFPGHADDASSHKHPGGLQCDNGLYFGNYDHSESDHNHPTGHNNRLCKSK